MRLLWRRLRFWLRAKGRHVSRPEFAPIGESRRQRRPDLTRTELQKTVTRPTRESVSQASRKIGIKKWRAILLLQRETPVRSQDRRKGKRIHVANVSAKRGNLQRLGRSPSSSSPTFDQWAAPEVIYSKGLARYPWRENVTVYSSENRNGVSRRKLASFAGKIATPQPGIWRACRFGIPSTHGEFRISALNHEPVDGISMYEQHLAAVHSEHPELADHFRYADFSLGGSAVGHTLGYVARMHDDTFCFVSVPTSSAFNFERRGSSESTTTR